MKKFIAISCSIVVVLMTLLTGCNTVGGTVHGAGKDIQALGGEDEGGGRSP